VARQDYTILNTLHESENTKVFLASRGDDQQKVVLKTAAGKGMNEYARIQNEYIVTNALNDVVHPVMLDTLGDLPCLVRPYIEGPLLSKSIPENGMDVKLFLDTAIAIAAHLQRIHECNVIHKDINPQNIILTDNGKTAAIIDFDIASQFDRKLQVQENPEHLEGTLRYISPEQTGRMNRHVDYRSDLYSFGICLYEMASGRVPFAYSDAIELVHAHIAKPLPPSSPHVPLQLVAIISKLTAKNAEDRYQSAEGVKKDLQRCLDAWNTKGKLTEFPTAEDDRIDKLLIPEKLYGREKELQQLSEAFTDVSNGGRKIFSISGYPGIGKTSLVLDLYKRLPEKNGIFVTGKFDLFHKNNPYFGWFLALTHFLEFILTENQQQMDEWRKKLDASLGPLAAVLTEQVPELEMVMGKQPPVPPLPPKESENRFAYAVRSFIAAIADHEHPLIIFIDDFQWADFDSIGLLKSVALDPQCSHVMLIVAYRDNEIEKSHPLLTALAEIRSELAHEQNKNGDAAESLLQIRLENLSKRDVKQLVVDTLLEDSPGVDALTELVYEKTQGNSFFVNQFLRALYEEKLIVFDASARHWTWDIEKIRRKNITDNVVELLAEQVKKLSVETQEVLTLASCIGSRFDLRTLSTIYEKSTIATADQLKEALLQGYIIPEANNYKLVQQLHEAENPVFLFVHDRIQQAVYSLIPEQEKALTHYRIGKLLLPDRDRTETMLFDIVNHFDKATAIIDAADKKEIASLNYEAGINAKGATAFYQAYNYFSCALSLLPGDSWETDYEFTLRVHNEAAESAYLSKKPTDLQNISREVIIKAHSSLDKVNVYMSRILSLTAANKLKEATAESLDILRQLGVWFPSKPNHLSVIRNLIMVRMMLPSKKISRIVDFPQLTDQTQLAVARILVNSAAAFFLSTPALYPHIIFKLVSLSVKHGNCAESLVGYGSYGLIIAGIVGDIEAGYQLGKQSLLLLEKYNRKDLTAIAQFTYSSFIHHWKDPLAHSIRDLHSGFEKGLFAGSIEYSAWCMFAKTWAMLFSGQPLREIEETFVNSFEMLQQYGQLAPLNYERSYYSAVKNLIYKTDQPTVLRNEFFDETVMEPIYLREKDKASANGIYFNKMMLAFLFEKDEEAIAQADKFRAFLDISISTSLFTEFHFFEALISIRAAENNPGNRRKYLKRAKSNLAKFKKWSRFSPENYLNKKLLIEAELNRIHQKPDKAMPLYDSSIEWAHQNKLLHEEAIALEAAGNFYSKRNEKEKTEQHYIRAIGTYRQWGALNKASYTEQKYLAPQEPTVTRKLQTVFTEKTIFSSSGLDALSIIKSSQTLSGEIVLSTLLEKLMKLVIENAGAEKGSLLLMENGELVVKAEASVHVDEVRVVQPSFPDGSGDVCTAIVNYVAHTKEGLLLEDAASIGQFTNDPYIRAKKIKSVLCAPIQNQGKLTGITYLENNLATNAFTRNRLDIVNILSSQAAISIDNARLYEDLSTAKNELEEYNLTLELKVEERTEEIRKQKDLITIEKQKSDALLRNILPEETAEELKATGTAQPRRFNLVTVMFTDFVNFTGQSELISADDLVKEINFYYSTFDEIISKYGIEKIKTIGDSYMCAGGLPVENTDNPLKTIQAALEIQEFMKEEKNKRLYYGNTYFESRIGIHSGPVVAGIVGIRKFAYDIWGDTVNIASKMETSGEPGKVNISGTTYELIKDSFHCTHRGKIQAKHKGEIDMYFVDQNHLK
jgi:histidine kinase